MSSWGMYGSGFNQYITLQSGQFISIRRYGKAYGNSGIWDANAIRVYETPNLLSQSDISITPDTSTSLAGYEADNLITNLDVRSPGNHVKPYRDATT